MLHTLEYCICSPHISPSTKRNKNTEHCTSPSISPPSSPSLDLRSIVTPCSFQHFMAYSPSPHIASLPAPGSSSRFNRHSPPPPLQQPLSKRDKKRNAMENALAEISSSFAENRDHLYRKQLQALQADMNYIQAARLYDNVPLDGIGDEGPEEANTSAAASSAGSLRNAHQAHLNGHTRLEFPYKTGPQTAQFIQEINNAMEQRDADLTTVVVSNRSLPSHPPQSQPVLSMSHQILSRAPRLIQWCSSTATTSGSEKFRKRTCTALTLHSKSIDS